jgi:hypothetical protein
MTGERGHVDREHSPIQPDEEHPAILVYDYEASVSIERRHENQPAISPCVEKACTQAAWLEREAPDLAAVRRRDQMPTIRTEGNTR